MTETGGLHMRAALDLADCAPPLSDRFWGGPPQGDKLGTLVVVLPNDNWSWTYKLKVTCP